MALSYELTGLIFENKTNREKKKGCKLALAFLRMNVLERQGLVRREILIIFYGDMAKPEHHLPSLLHWYSHTPQVPLQLRIL